MERSQWKNRVGQHDERGFVLPLLIIALLFASMLVVPFLDFARLRFGHIERIATEEEAYFAADAGIEVVLADLRRGIDVLAGGYVLPVLELNGFTPVISITAPPRFDMAPFGAVFVDPETNTSLNPVASSGTFEYQLDNVQPFSDFQVSWVYTPAGNNWRLRVYEGAGTGGTLMETVSGNSSPARLDLDSKDINGGGGVHGRVQEQSNRCGDVRRVQPRW